MKSFGAKLSTFLKGGEVIELVGDVGAGKTTLAKGLAGGLGISEDVQSPSFTISRVYETSTGLQLAHYDFYRLNEAGIMASELHEMARDPRTITLIEWADVAHGVLPADRLTLIITPTNEDARKIMIQASGAKSQELLQKLT